MAALNLAARTEGMVLDPTYTGRAMAGLFGHAATLANAEAALAAPVADDR